MLLFFPNSSCDALLKSNFSPLYIIQTIMHQTMYIITTAAILQKTEFGSSFQNRYSIMLQYTTEAAKRVGMTLTLDDIFNRSNLFGEKNYLAST